MTTTTNIGDSLRDSVYSLLEAAKKQKLDMEVRLAGKKADIYFEEVINRKRVFKIAVECKNYEKNLSNSDIAKIIYDYTPAITSNSVSYVQIVSRNGLTSDGLATLESNQFFEHYTYDEYCGSLMNFDRYIDSLISEYENSGLSEYYIEQSLIEEQSKDRFSLPGWYDNDNPTLAILAGYGMGKTSFSQKIAYEFANFYKQSFKTRIPILIKLGKLSKEQSVEGLISTTFTANGMYVENYNFELFQELNKKGYFLIILDGFDEMKHAMNFHDFRANVHELNTLIFKKSKILLLGRPSAFMSEDEKELLLKGRKKVNDKEIWEVGFNDFTNTWLEPFNKEQFKEFTQQYLKYIKNNHPSLPKYINDDFIRKRENEIESLELDELLSRPVHARMLSEIAVGSQSEMKHYSRFELYSLFFELIYEREHTKNARNTITIEDRKEFTRSIAWHFWVEKKQVDFAVSEIPQSLIKKYSESYEMDHDSIRRDLVSSSVLETKNSNQFYFPHRSFQEFNVSEYIIHNNKLSHSSIQKIDEAITFEVSQFLSESPQREEITSRLHQSLSQYTGQISSSLVLHLSMNMDYDELLRIYHNSFDDNPWNVYIFYLFANLKELHKKEVPSLNEVAGTMIDKSGEKAKFTSHYIGLLIASSVYKEQVSSLKMLVIRVLSNYSESSFTIMHDALSRTSKFSSYALKEELLTDEFELLVNILSTREESDEIKFKVSLKDVLIALKNQIYNSYWISEFDIPDDEHIFSINLQEVTSRYKKPLKGNDKSVPARFFRKFDNLKKLVPTSVAKAQKKKRPVLSINK